MVTVAQRPWIANLQPVGKDDLLGDLITSEHPMFGLVWINPDRLGGTACFYGSRVPIQNLFDYLESGQTLD